MSKGKTKSKIKKNLSDQDMLANFKEDITFENQDDAVELAPPKKGSRDSDSFLTPELQEQLNKALLELKVKLYQKGIIDYDLKISQEGSQIQLTAVPSKKKKNSHPDNRSGGRNNY